MQRYYIAQQDSISICLVPGFVRDQQVFRAGVEPIFPGTPFPAVKMHGMVRERTQACRWMEKVMLE